MDCLQLSWLSEMGLDNSFFSEQSDFSVFNNTLDDDLAAVLRQDFDIYSPPLYTDNNNNDNSNNNNNNNNNNMVEGGYEQQQQQQPPTKLLKPNDFSQFSSGGGAAAPIILNFENSLDKVGPTGPSGEEVVVVMRPEQQGGGEEEERRVAVVHEQPAVKKTGRVRPPSQTYDHIIAERKRREQLSQRFLALSTMVPGLKKMDKTSVLGDAINYLKHLQERVKTLEAQTSRQTMESVVLVRKSQLVAAAAEDDADEGVSDELPLPEIEARVCNNHLLLRVHCERRKSILVNLLCEIETLHMAVINTNITPFGSFAIDITIVAEMEKEFKLTVKEVVQRLRSTLKQFN